MTETTQSPSHIEPTTPTTYREHVYAMEAGKAPGVATVTREAGWSVELPYLAAKAVFEALASAWADDPESAP